MRRRTLLRLAGAALAAPPRLAGAQPAAVDLLLVLAVDVSRSMDEEEGRLQRQGYAEALRDPAVLSAIADGPIGAIGLAYLEWSGPEHQALILPWTCIDGGRAAEACASRLHEAPVGIGTWTSISAALDRAREAIAAAPFATERRVVDVSGDGVNNAGAAVEEARDRAVAAGIIVNGLPVMKDGGAWHPLSGGTRTLEEYYREQVIGGIGAFVLPTEDFRSFGTAIRRKLIREIADGRPGVPQFAGRTTPLTGSMRRATS